MDNCTGGRSHCEPPAKTNLLNASTVDTDAFGRQRVSTPYTLFDSQNRFGLDPQFFSNLLGNVSITFSNSEVGLNILSNTYGQVVRQTKYSYAYQPGKSLLVMTTFRMASKEESIVQRIGYFNSTNGIFLEQSDKLYIVIRNGTETKVEQSLWNYDTMNGLGPSKAVLDMSKVQLFWMDIEWLGVGTVRTGFLIDGKLVPVHYFHHANYVTSVYTLTAILPVRYEISGSSPATLKQICSTVISEGGYEPKTPLYYYQVGTTNANSINLGTAGQLYPILSLKLKSAYLGAIVTIRELNLVVTSADSVTFYLIRNGTVNTNVWVNHQTSNIVQVNTDATSISGGEILLSKIVSQRSDVSFTSDNNNRIGAKSLTESDVLTLAAAGFSPNLKVSAIVSWTEL